jgi:hypothetical protein
MMGLLRILLTEIPRASPARQREQTATGAVTRPYREDSPLPVKSADGGRSGFGKADNQREIAVGLRNGRPARLRALSHCAAIPKGSFWRKAAVQGNDHCVVENVTTRAFALTIPNNSRENARWF